jgi:hypothetical protein
LDGFRIKSVFTTLRNAIERIKQVDVRLKGEKIRMGATAPVSQPTNITLSFSSDAFFSDLKPDSHGQYSPSYVFGKKRAGEIRLIFGRSAQLATNVKHLPESRN